MLWFKYENENGNIMHQSHTTFNVHGNLHVVMQQSFYVSYSTCMFHIQQLEPRNWHPNRTDFKSTLILNNIHLKMFLDVCLGMNMKIQTQKFFSETIFPQFVLVLTLFVYYPRSLVFYEYTCFISRFSPRPSYAVQYSWTSVPGKAAYRRTGYDYGKSGKKDKDIVFVEVKKKLWGN